MLDVCAICPPWALIVKSRFSVLIPLSALFHVAVTALSGKQFNHSFGNIIPFCPFTCSFWYLGENYKPPQITCCYMDFLGHELMLISYCLVLCLWTIGYWLGISGLLEIYPLCFMLCDLPTLSVFTKECLMYLLVNWYRCYDWK